MKKDNDLLIHAGETANDHYALDITPERAGWRFSGIKIVELDDLDAAEAPAGPFGGDVQGVVIVCGLSRMDQEVVVFLHSSPTALSTAAATSSPGGYSSDRPITRPRTVGRARALAPPARATSGSSETSPPRIRAGRVEAAMTRSISGTQGSLSQV